MVITNPISAIAISKIKPAAEVTAGFARQWSSKSISKMSICPISLLAPHFTFSTDPIMPAVENSVAAVKLNNYPTFETAAILIFCRRP
jgi:hypothetical protein